MKKNSNAFTLIKSLTMSEKRYFKIFSERHTIGEQNKYVALFDQLDKAEVEDDLVIKKNIKALGINSDFLSADKNYLYQLILRSLNVFHYSKTYNLEIKEALLSIEVLFHKGLYKECLGLITKTELLAEECENFQLSIDLLMWKKKCSGYSLGLKKAAEVNLLIDKYLVLLSNLKKITDLYYESNLLQSDHENYSKNEISKKFKNIINQPELRSEKNALSFSSKVFYYLVYSNYYYSIDDKQKEFEYLQKLVDMLNASRTYATENPLDYVSIYNRLLAIKKYFPSTSFFNDIKLLNDFSKKVQIRNEVVMERVFVHTNTHVLEYYLINNDFQSALNKTKEIEKEITKLHLDIESYHMIYFYYLHAIILIYVGQYHKALKYINNILNDFDYAARPQVYLRVEILNAIVHYELKNFSLVTSVAKKVLKKNNDLKILHPIEESFLKVLVKIASNENLSHKEEILQFQVALNEIDSFRKNNKVQLSSLIDNYEKWLKAKISKKFVADTFQ